MTIDKSKPMDAHSKFLSTYEKLAAYNTTVKKPVAGIWPGAGAVETFA
jgi:hypothetical protein